MWRLSSVLFVGLVACGGEKIRSKEDLGLAVAHAIVPGLSYRDIALSVAETAITNQPKLTVRGSDGGKAELSINPAGAVVGLVGQGLLFDIDFSGYSEYDVQRFDGHLSVLANFKYVAAEDPYADIRLSLVGKVVLGGVYADTLRSNVALTTRVHDLEFREGSIQMRLDGYVEGEEMRFDFATEDLAVDWARFATLKP